MARGIEVVDPPEEIPSGDSSSCVQIPEWTQAWAGGDSLHYRHFSVMWPRHTNTCQRFVQMWLPWLKITEKTTLMSVINGVVRPLVQLNVPEGFLNPLEVKKSTDIQKRKRRKR